MPGDLRGQHVIQWVPSVKQDPVQLFHSNVSTDGAQYCYICPHNICCCPCCLVQLLYVYFPGAAKVAHLVVEHGTLDDGLVEASQDLLVCLESFQLSEKVHVLVCFLAACLNV